MTGSRRDLAVSHEIAEGRQSTPNSARSPPRSLEGRGPALCEQKETTAEEKPLGSRLYTGSTARAGPASEPFPKAAVSHTQDMRWHARATACSGSRSRPILLQHASAAIMILSLRTENTTRRHAAL